MNNESEVEVTTENPELNLDLDVETPEEAPVEEKPIESPEAKLARLKRQAAQLEKKLGVKEPESKPSGKLDETQLDYLDLKGITEEEDIRVIETVMKNTGKSLRDTLKDDYVVSTLHDNANTRNVRNAIPGATKRAGVDSNSVEYYVNKWKATGKLPDNFELQSKVVDAIASEKSDRSPSWKR